MPYLDPKIKKQYDLLYYRTHKREAIRKAALYYKIHKQKRLQQVSKWQKENPNKHAEYASKFQKNHRQQYNSYYNERRTRCTKAGGSYTSAQWVALCDKYNNLCLCCGKCHKLTADHVIPVAKGGTSNISNIQPLCGPCNSSKGAKTTDYRSKYGTRRK